MKSDFTVTLAYCTFPDEGTAVHICEKLVQETIIACANVLPAHRSIYKWNEYLENKPETAAILKLSLKNKQKLMERIQELHPYDVPALVFLNPDDGLPSFLKWVYEQSP